MVERKTGGGKDSVVEVSRNSLESLRHQCGPVEACLGFLCVQFESHLPRYRF